MEEKQIKNFFTLKVEKSAPLTKEEIIEGNTLLLKFMEFDCDKSEEWILNCALYDKSYSELMSVALKIETFYDENYGSMNASKFNYRHMMFHEILDLSIFYRKTVKFVKEYFDFIESLNG
jgi:hypothetical protein